MKRPYLVPPESRPADEDSVTAAISPIEEIIEDARNGRPYILVDAEDRENEGDVIIPAQFATPEQINFMAKHARGLICLSITADGAQAAGTTLMAVRAIIHAMRGWPTPFGAALNATVKLFDEAGVCREPKDAWQLDTVAEQVMEFASMRVAHMKTGLGIDA